PTSSVTSRFDGPLRTRLQPQHPKPMIKQRIQLRNVSNVAASKTAILEIPIGPRYHYINLQHGYASGTNTIAAAATNVAEVRQKVNGRVQRVASGTQL